MTRTLALLILAEEETVIDDAGVVAREFVHAGFRLHPTILDAFRGKLDTSRGRRGTRKFAAWCPLRESCPTEGDPSHLPETAVLETGWAP